MAKTTSQIIAENKKKRAEEAKIQASRDTIHKKQMAELGGSSAKKTAAVLKKAIAGTTDNEKKKNVQKALQLVEQGDKRKNPTTAREEQFSLRTAPETSKQKKDRTKKEYDDYVSSNEYKQRVTANDQKARAEAAAQMFLNPGQPLQMPKAIQDEKEQKLRAARDAAEAEYKESEDQRIIEQDMEAVTGLSAEERQQLEQYAVNQIRDQNLPIEMQGVMPTAQQEAAGIVNKYGRGRVDELAETYMRQENAKMAQTVDEKSREFADKHGVIGSIATIPAAAYSGIVGTVGQLQGMARNTGRYQTLDPNATGTIGDTFTGAVRGQVGENIEEGLGGGFLGKAGSVAYQGVMSAADSIARGYLGGGALGGAALAATGSFSQTMAEASRQGATPAQAALLATVNSGIEAVSEKIPLDNLIRTAKGTGAKTVIANALRQMGIEATTEEISLLGTVLAEAAILQEKSSYNREVTTAILAGLSPDEAINQANRTILNEAVNTALVSAVSGGLSSLGGSYADARGMFAQTQEQTNPELNRPQNVQQATQEAIANNQARRERMAAEEAAQQPQAAAPTAETAVQPQQQAEAQTAPQQAPQAQQPAAQPNISDVVADVITRMQENSGKASNRMAETVMSDPTLMHELGITTEGTKAEQRRRVKEEMEKLFQKQNVQPETTQNVPATEPMQTTETSEQAIKQASAPQADMQMGVTNQSAEGGQIRGTGAAERNFTGKAAYQDLLQEGNVQRDRPGDVRPMEVPKTDTKGRKVSETVGNFYGASVTSDEMANRIEELVQDGALSYDTRSNQQSLNNAATAIQKYGEESTRTAIAKNVGQRKIQDGDIEKALILFAKDANDPNRQESAAEMMVQLQEMATMSGRNLQLFRLVRRMTPEGQLMAVQKEVRQNTEKMIKAGQVKKGFEPVVNTELEQEYLQAAKDAKNAKTDKARQEAEQSMQELQNAMRMDAAAQMPSTFKAKWDAWRYMAMLGNAKTQVRNVVGNLAFKPYKEVKDKMGALAEKIFVPKDQRTKSLITDQALAKWAREDAKTQNVNDALKYSAKLGDDVSNQKTRENMQVFKNKALEGFRKFVEGVPQAGDMLFKSNYYERSLAGFLKARGYTAADVQNGNVSDSVLNEARSYAIQEAMKATFNDSNAFSDFMATGLRYKGDNPIGKAMNLAAEGVLPFRRTPANIAVRFSEYSPVGVAKGLWNAATKVRNGEMTAATVIDQLSSGLTGSAVMALGFALAGGLDGIKITGSGTDEDEKRQGHQDYAFEFSIDGQEYSYKIDWAAPANLPLFVGANIYKALEDAGENTDVSAFTSFIRGMGTAFEPMLALSCMSSLNDLVEGVRYADEGEALYTIAAKAATGYFTQGIPALARQATQAFTENKQTTFTTSDDPTIRDLQSTAAGLGVGNLYKTDKVNAWGEKESTGTAFESIVNSFFNPGTLKKIDNSDVEKEITRLNDAGMNVSPDTAPKTVSFTDKDGNGHDAVRLTEEQYQTYAQTQGQTARKLVDDMIKSADYKAMTDEEKAEAINTAYQYAKMKAEIAAIGDDHTGYDQSWMYDVERGGAMEIIQKTIVSSLSSAKDNLSNAWKNGYDEAAFIQEMETAFNSYKNASAKMQRQVYEESSSETKNYIDARQKGISNEKYLSVAKSLSKTGDTIIEKSTAIVKHAGLTDAQKTLLVKQNVSDAQDENIDLLMKMGYGVTDYVGLYTDYKTYTSGDGKKRRTISKWMKDYNIDYSTAEKIYKVFP